MTLSRRAWLGAVGALAATAAWGSASALAQQATPVASPVSAGRDWRQEHWVGSWFAPVHPPFAGAEGMEMFPSQLIPLDAQTLRQIVRVSAGGDRARVRISNRYGVAPLTIGAAHLALRDAEARIDPASDRTLTFSGSPAATIPPGAMVLSDPADLLVPPLAELAVSLYFPDPVKTTTVHGFGFQTNYISGEGDFSAAAELPVDSTIQNWAFLTGVDVAVAAPTGVVVALGDSITDGAFSTPDTNQRWPDLLANRFAAEGPPFAVLNAGIGGNRLLGSEAGPMGLAFGENALARFDRDVLAQPGVTHLVVFEGLNDILLPALFSEAVAPATPEAIIFALRQIIERAHQHNIVVYGATLTPVAGWQGFSPEAESTRQVVNDWIRTSGAFDAVIDFDAIVRDPSNPTALLPAFDAGDHLHINDAGFHAMADGIDLALFAAGSA